MFIKQKRAQSSYNLFFFFKYVYVADFLKTNLTKTAVIAVKKRQIACFFLCQRSSKIILRKKKENSKRESEQKERGRRKKSNGCTLSFFNSFFGR